MSDSCFSDLTDVSEDTDPHDNPDDEMLTHRWMVDNKQVAEAVLEGDAVAELEEDTEAEEALCVMDH